jgi:hypothetical protein
MAELPSLSVPEYGSAEYFKNLADIYGQAQAPAMERQTAQLKNLLGGRGTISGTPMYGKYTNQIAQPYAQGLNTMLGTEASNASKYFAEKPLAEAAVTGTYNGLPTLANQEFQKQYTDMTPYQEAQIGALTDAQQLANYKAMYELLANYMGWNKTETEQEG